MKTVIGVAASLLLLAAPSRAITPVVTPISEGAGGPVDPLKWTPEHERNLPSQWYTVTIGGDTYLGYNATVDERKAAGYKAPDTGFLWATPLLKLTGVAAGDAKLNKSGGKVARVTTEPTALLLEFSVTKGEYKVVCTDAAKCKDVDVASAKTLSLGSDKTALRGFDASEKGLMVVVVPPGSSTPAADDKKTTAAGDGDPLDAWEQAAAAKGSVGGANEQDEKQDTTNAKKRETLIAHLNAYVTAEEKDKGPIKAQEIVFVHQLAEKQKDRNLPVEGFDAAAGLVRENQPDPKSAAYTAFVARWRKFILAEVKTYLANGPSLQPHYEGSASALGDLDKDIRANGTGPASDVELGLSKAHPGTTRMDEAQRKIVAAYIKAHPELKGSDKQLVDAAKGGDANAFNSLWVRITGGDRLKDAALTGKSNNGLETLVDRDVLLDAYCDPKAFHGGAAPEPRKRSARAQAERTAKNSGAAASGASLDQTGTGGNALDGGGTATVSAGDPCAGRLQQLQSRFPDAKTGPVGNLGLDRPTGVEKDDKNNTGTDQTAGDKFVKHEKGDNKVPEDKAKDPNMADHIRSGAVVGGFLGLLGMIGGGPLGLLIMGGAGFAIGFGLDMMTNKPK